MIHYHDYQITDAKTATCTSGGFCTYYCEGCQDGHTEQIGVLGHNYSGATCTSASVCSRCGLQEQAALGHTTSTGVCARCNYNFTAPLYFSGSGDGIFNNYHSLVLPYGTYKITLKIKYTTSNWDMGVCRDNLSAYNSSVLVMFDYRFGTFTDYFTAEIVSGGYIWVRIDGYYEIAVTPVN